MNDFAIRAEGLSKRYQIGGKQGPYKTMRDTLAGAATAPFRAIRSTLKRSNGQDINDEKTIWAIKDVSFEVKRGEVAGIIGRNGAGKSTLLKVLSRITDPTEGYVDVTGRIGSLLEVGTGFHPELSGRENIYLNGAILGMKKAELKRKFDEIVAFAEVEKFVDTPVKHYSSGMYLRLAFAVAAHLEPEILLVDEVLAVGDAAFQKKCLGKMGDVAKEGRTILFVSHNMGAIRSLCSKGIVLKDGRIYQDGDVSQCIEAYARSIGMLQNPAEGEGGASENGFRNPFDPILVNSRQGSTISQSEGFELSTALHIDHEISGFSLFCILEYMDGIGIATVREDISASTFKDLVPGKYQIAVKFPPLWLRAGMFAAHFKAQPWGDQAGAKYVSDRIPLDVEGEGSLTQSLLQPPVDWSIQRSEL